jgi:TniQ
MSARRVEIADRVCVEAPIVPARSVLAGLAPVGVGSPDAESLSGYVVRIAAAHHLAPSRLARFVLAPELGRPEPGLEVDDWGRYFAAIFSRPRASLNGTGCYAATWAGAFSGLTGRGDLHALTLVAWASVLPAKGLLRAERVYCPACLDEWGTSSYEPLRWQFRSLEVCVRHELRLRSACPDRACGAGRGILASWARVGRCACGRELRMSLRQARSNEAPIDPDFLAWQRFVDASLGSLVAATPTLDGPVSGLLMPEAIAIAIERATGGNLTRFAAAVRMELSTASLWRSGRRQPTLEAALRICAVAGFELVDFLVGRLEALRAAPAAPLSPPGIPASHERHRRIDWRAIERDLRATLDHSVPPALNAVLRELGVDDGSAKRRMPDLCGAVRDRHTAWRAAELEEAQLGREAEVRRMIGEIDAAGRYPSRHQVQKRLPTGIHLRDARLARLWRAEVLALGWPEARYLKHPSVVLRLVA